MLEELREKVCSANIELYKKGIVIYTWGNVSGIDRHKGLVVIKPSGVSYDDMKPEDMVVVDIDTGKIIEGSLKPSSDTKTHLEIYRAFDMVSGVVHTHSENASAFAQAGIDIKALGTTHADYFYGDIPCTRTLTQEEVEDDYETDTGKVIVETFQERNIDPLSIPGVVVAGHGPFCWGVSPDDAVHNAVVMEEIAAMNIKTLLLNPDAKLPGYVLDKHYNRKHGKDAYYGQ